MVDATVNNEYIPITGVNCQEIEHSKEDDISITIFGLQRNKQRECFFHFISIIFLCIPYILLFWFPNWSRFKYKLCALKNAEYVLVKDNLEQYKVIAVDTVDYYFNDNHELLHYFKYQHVKYIWKENISSFCNTNEYVKELTLNDFFTHKTGLNRSQQNELLKLYGSNLIDIEVKSYWHLFINEVFNPFYVFQAFSVILWSCDDYYYYAGCILFLSFLSIVTSLRETKKQSTALNNLVESSRSHSVVVCRPNIISNGENNETYDCETIDPSFLVPGDVIQIPIHGCIMPCDAVLLSGNCIVNESMLTGESVPITKTPPNPSDEIYNPSIHKRHTLFSGTQVIQTRYYGDLKVLAQVVRTGFETTKGELVKSIMYPKPIGFAFYKDSMRFVFFLFFVALIGMSYCVYLYIKRQADLETILLRTLDIITIIVPPALPAAMTAGTVYSQTRLKNFGIYCMSPMKINVAGKIKLICFDKTGTLTHDGLDLYAVIPSDTYNFKEPVFNIMEIDKKSPLIQAMACCHSLTRLDGIINGDPLDLNMFEATKWILEEPGPENSRFEVLAPTIVYPSSESIQISDLPFNSTEMNNLPYQIGLLRQFPFSSTEQCMSVICRTLGSKHMTVYVKGAPEKIIKLCKFESIPTNFYSLLTKYAMEGYRIIALAYKNLDKKLKWKDIQKIAREKVECDLEFIGLLIMQNALKPQTTPIIKDLQSAKIRIVMITGDNIMTAISVSRDCGMILPQENIILVTAQNDLSDTNQRVPKIKFEFLNSTNVVPGNEGINNSDSSILLPSHMQYHFALDGKTWNVIRTYYASWIPKLILKGTIYARFRPEQKTQLVIALQELDYVVGMVGDGANDCGALKAAHVGISLSQAEASVAAPFTSTLQDISCVKYIVLEGRCALVTSFAIFKYMALYSFIQFFSVLILYTRASEFGNMEFLYIDLVVTTTLAICLGRQEPSTILVPFRPKGSLVSLGNLIPLVCQIIICANVQISSLYVLTLQPWYHPLNEKTIKHGEENVLCWDNTVIFIVSGFQYLILALVYSKGKPFRKSAVNNGLLMFSLLALTSFNVLLLIYPFQSLADFLEIMPLKSEKENKFRNLLLIFPIVNLILSVFLETLVADTHWFKTLIHFIKCKKCPKNKFKNLDQQFRNQEWFTLDNDFDVNHFVV